MHSGKRWGRILVVDDQAPITEILREMLGTLGYTVKVAMTGEDGLDQVATFQPDVVILDLSLPGMMGAEVLDRLRQTHPHIAVIAMTGHPDRARGILERGAVAYLAKPFDLMTLRRVVGRVLGEK